MPTERLFVDTNVLLAATVPARQGHAAALTLFAEAASHGAALVASGQVLREYLAVATRPVAANGLGLECGPAADNADAFTSRLELLAEDRNVAAALRRLVRDQGVRGRQVHDASIVATMLTHGVRDLVTSDGTDFARFAEHVVVRPLAYGLPWGD